MSKSVFFRAGILLVLSVVTSVSAGAVYTIIPIALTGQQAPGQSGVFTSFGLPVVNSQGQVAFGAVYQGEDLTNCGGLYFWSNGILSRVVDCTVLIPGDPMHHNFPNSSEPILSNTGHVAFSTGYFGVYRWDGGPLVTIADSWNTPVPGHPTSYFNGLAASSINDSDVVAFGGQGGSVDGIYTGTGGNLTKIADSDTPVPGQPAARFPSYWGTLEAGAINSAGDVAFKAYYTGGEGTHGLYINTSGELQRIADGSTVPPGQTAPFDCIVKPSLNSTAQVAFHGYRGSDGAYDGAYLWTNGQLSVIDDSDSGLGDPRINDNGTAVFTARTDGGQFCIVKVDSGIREFIVSSNDPVPGWPDASWFGQFADPFVDTIGTVVFSGFWHSPSLGYTGEGIYTNWGGSLVKVIDTKDTLFEGQTASALDMVYYVDLGGRSPFNDNGQVAFWAKLSDGRQGIFLANPVCVPPVGDFNGDCAVNFRDYADFALHWLDVGCIEPSWCGKADLDKSGEVNITDLGIFVKHWLEGTVP